MVKICVDLGDIEAYEELKRYLKSKSGKYRGLLGNEIAKAIKLYVQQLKASEGTPQSPQQKSVTEKTEESKPIKVTETAKELTKAGEELTKRIEDLTQRTENLEKELKATGETVKSLTKNIADIGNKIDEYVKQRLEQILKTIMSKITEAVTSKIDEHCFMVCGSIEERRASLEELLRPSLKKLKDEIKQEVKNEIMKAIEEKKQEEKKGFLW
jgi:phage-related minor tail protein